MRPLVERLFPLLGLREPMRSLGILVFAFLLSCPAITHARQTVGEPRFPAILSESVLKDLVATGQVEPVTTRDPDAAIRWGTASPDLQESSIRAVISALIGSRPPLSVSAAILAIARVESGWNPESRNPSSSACGLFQFVRATWESYGTPHHDCVDPALNACVGVEHLTSLYRTTVYPQIAPLRLLASEGERAEWTYRLLYAYHYHGEGSPVAPVGGTDVSQSAADAGLQQFKSIFAILKKATAPPRRTRSIVRRAAVPRAKHRRRG